MAPGVIEFLKEWIQPSVTEDYEVEEYVLSRRNPDPENRIAVYDEPKSPDDIGEDRSLSPGTYILQEIKTNGMAGDVVWETTLGEDVDA